MTRIRLTARTSPIVACICTAAVFASGEQPQPTKEVSAAVVRDPFWPIGYAPKPKVIEAPPANASTSVTGVVTVPQVVPPVAIEEPIVWPELKTRGIMHDRAKGKFWATIEGIGIVEAGDAPEVTKGSYVYSFEIKAITATGVSYVKSSVRKVRKTGK